MTLSDVLNLMKSDRCNFQSLAAAIENNKSIVQKVLGRVNSPLFGLGNPVKELYHGVSILGIRRVRELLLQSTSNHFYHHFLKIEGALQEMKKHSIAVGCYAEEMAKALRQVFSKEFYKAALLHDIGKYPLLIAMGSGYLKLQQQAEEMNYSFFQHERDQLRFDHTEIGYEMAQAWELKESFANVIRYHHEITEEQKEALTTRDTWLVEIISFANLMCQASGVRSRRSVYRKYLSDLPPPPGDFAVNQLEKISEQANSRYMEELKALGIL